MIHITLRISAKYMNHHLYTLLLAPLKDSLLTAVFRHFILLDALPTMTNLADDFIILCYCRFK